MDPCMWLRSSYSKARSPFPLHTFLIPECIPLRSKHSGTEEIPPFSSEVSIHWLFWRFSIKNQAAIEKNLFPPNFKQSGWGSFPPHPLRPPLEIYLLHYIFPKRIWVDGPFLQAFRAVHCRSSCKYSAHDSHPVYSCMSLTWPDWMIEKMRHQWWIQTTSLNN